MQGVRSCVPDLLLCPHLPDPFLRPCSPDPFLCTRLLKLKLDPFLRPCLPFAFLRPHFPLPNSFLRPCLLDPILRRLERLVQQLSRACEAQEAAAGKLLQVRGGLLIRGRGANWRSDRAGSVPAAVCFWIALRDVPRPALNGAKQCRPPSRGSVSTCLAAFNIVCASCSNCFPYLHI